MVAVSACVLAVTWRSASLKSAMPIGRRRTGAGATAVHTAARAAGVAAAAARAAAAAPSEAAAPALALAAGPAPAVPAAVVPPAALAAASAALAATRSPSKYSRMGQYAAAIHRFFRSLPE